MIDEPDNAVLEFVPPLAIGTVPRVILGVAPPEEESGSDAVTPVTVPVVVAVVVANHPLPLQCSVIDPPVSANVLAVVPPLVIVSEPFPLIVIVLPPAVPLYTIV
jgi:hypothetical protein